MREILHFKCFVRTLSRENEMAAAVIPMEQIRNRPQSGTVLGHPFVLWSADPTQHLRKVQPLGS